jgi:hypothetical protein
VNESRIVSLRILVCHYDAGLSVFVDLQEDFAPSADTRFTPAGFSLALLRAAQC